MAKNVAIGIQSFAELREKDYFYVDKTDFIDLNNLKIVTTTSDEYATSFGFTEKEVFAALEEYGYSDEKEAVKQWYDGFTFEGKKVLIGQRETFPDV